MGGDATGESTRKALLAACAVASVATFASTVVVAVLASLTGVRIAIVNAAILLGATWVLGAAWSLRQQLGLRSYSPSLAAGAVPAIACALFLVPRLVLGPSSPAFVTLAASAATAPLVSLAWGRVVDPEDHADLRWRRAFAVASPPIAFACASAILLEGAALLVVFASIALAAALAWRALAIGRRTHEESLAFARQLGEIVIESERVVRSRSARPTDRWLSSLAAAVDAQLARVEAEAKSDALARDAIANARQLRTRFMASMSHELRSPLNSIVGFAHVLEQGLDGTLSEGQRESVVMVRRSAEELILLLTDILDLARLEAGRLHLRREWTPSVEILTEAVGRGRSLVEGREVEIEAELQPGLPPVFVDQKRIQQAVVALFRNAALSLRKTKIRLRARIANGPPGPARHLRVEIHDALGAIPEEDVDRIFEAFQEISEPAGRRVGGLGMALSLSRGLVRLHGGEVWADVHPSAGTVFCVALPLDDVALPGLADEDRSL